MTALTNYTFRAELDWAKVEFATSTRTKADKLWELLDDKLELELPRFRGQASAWFSSVLWNCNSMVGRG